MDHLFSWLHSTHLCACAALVAYVIALLLLLLQIQRGQPLGGPWVFCSLLLGFSIQCLGLSYRSMNMLAFPINNPFEISQLLILSLILLPLCTWPIPQLRVSVFFVTGLSSLLSAISLLLPWDYPYNPGPCGPCLAPHLHVVFVIFSFLMFSISVLASVMYLLQDYGLTRKRYQGLFGILPSLSQLRSYSQLFLAIGVYCLALASLIGWILSWQHTLAAPGSKRLVSMLLLVLYSSLLILQHNKHISAKASAWSSLLLFISAFLALGLLQPH